MESDILNAAVALGLEWGEHWMAPIQARIMKTFPQLTQTQADELEKLSRKVQSFAFKLYEDVYSKTMTHEAAESRILARFPFLDADNHAHIYNQGMYYAWHG